MWEIELRARIGAIRIPLWRTTDQETASLVVARLKERLQQARMARSKSVRQISASWLRMLDAIGSRLREIGGDDD